MKAGFMQEPEALATAVAAVLERTDSYHIRAALTGILEAHGTNQRRRAAVLEHGDLRHRLEHDLGYQRADQWNGFVPPATVNTSSTDELSRSVGQNGQVRLNQRGAYGIGEMPNDSYRRRILLEISGEAWDRSKTAAAHPGTTTPTPAASSPPAAPAARSSSAATHPSG